MVSKMISKRKTNTRKKYANSPGVLENYRNLRKKENISKKKFKTKKLK